MVDAANAAGTSGTEWPDCCSPPKSYGWTSGRAAGTPCARSGSMACAAAPIRIAALCSGIGRPEGFAIAPCNGSLKIMKVLINLRD